jgi:hypothetical protein
MRHLQAIGKTDDVGFSPIEDNVHVQDIQATILHLPRIDTPSSRSSSRGGTSG